MVTAVKVTAVSMVSIEQSSDGDNGDPGTTAGVQQVFYGRIRLTRFIG